MESPAHLTLKHAALAELARRGCTWAGLEVPGPLGRFRVDAAGLLPAATPAAPPPGWLFPGLFAPTILVECKVSRADFLRCTASGPALRRRRDRLRARRRDHDATFAGTTATPAAEPAAESSTPPDALFPLPPRPLHAARAVDTALARLERRLYAAAKFDLFTRYRLADFLLLVTLPGVLAPDELPPGWGWAEVHPGQALRLRAEPPALPSSPRWRSAIHRAAARAR